MFIQRKRIVISETTKGGHGGLPAWCRQRRWVVEMGTIEFMCSY